MQTIAAGQYRFEVPENWEVCYEERDIGVHGKSRVLRSWLIQQGERTLTAYLDEILSPEDLAEVVESQTRRRPRLEQLEINGLVGTYLVAFVEGWGRIEYWLKRGREMICFCIQGGDIRSREDASAMEQVVRSVRYLEA